MSSYANFIADMQAWAENDDEQFVAQLPRILRMVEHELSRRLRHLDFYKARDESVTTAVGTRDYNKPQSLLTPLSLTAKIQGKAVFIWERPLTFLDYYWPDGSATGNPPKFWASLSSARVRIAPTPNGAWPLTFFYTETPLALSETNPTNWLTANAYDLILNLGMVYAESYDKSGQGAAHWRGMAEPLVMAMGGTGAESHMDEASAHEPPPGR